MRLQELFQQFSIKLRASILEKVEELRVCASVHDAVEQQSNLIRASGNELATDIRRLVDTFIQQTEEALVPLIAGTGLKTEARIPSC